MKLAKRHRKYFIIYLIITMTLRKNPVVLVHGSSTVAAHGIGIAATFKSKGYTAEELYATTYGEPIPNSMYGRNRGYLCEYARGVRDLIKAVNAFTNRKVDVAAYRYKFGLASSQGTLDFIF